MILFILGCMQKLHASQYEFFISKRVNFTLGVIAIRSKQKNTPNRPNESGDSVFGRIDRKSVV